MFIEINGHLVNENAITQIAPGDPSDKTPSLVHLFGGGVVPVPDQVELETLREHLSPPTLSEPKPPTQPEGKSEKTK